jgi:hypothetical protein
VSETKDKTILRVDSRDFVALLADIEKTSGKDATLPMLDGVLLHVAQRGGRTILVATSTDRRIMAQAHIEAEGEMAQAFIPAEPLGDLLAILRPFARRRTSLWEIESDGPNLRFTQPSLTGLPSMTFGIKRPTDLKFPKRVGSLLSSEGSELSTDQVFLDGRYVALLAGIAQRRRESMRILTYGAMKPARVQIGQRYRAVVMPIREAGVADVPVFAPEGGEPEVRTSERAA